MAKSDTGGGSSANGGSVIGSYLRPILALVILGFTVIQGQEILTKAYTIRLHAIEQYGYIIHEFDPYFNFRAAQYLHTNGWKAFVNWFDHKSWYPLGRPVGTTIYPGMQVTAVWLTKSWLPFWFGFKEWIGTSIPPNVVAKSAWTVSKRLAEEGNSGIMARVAATMATMGMKWNEMSLNDVCCLLPAWFGALATFITGMLALECSTDFGYSEGSRFGTVLDHLPFVGYYIHKVTAVVRKFVAQYSGMDMGFEKGVSPAKRSSLQTASLLSMLATMFFMSTVPAHIMRSVGGGYDNESVAMAAMTLVFYTWTRSLRGISDGGDKQDAGFDISSQSKTAAFYGALTGVAYFYMVAAWGGYVFVGNLVGAHAGVLILLGRHSSKLHASYSAFYLVGTSLATTVPVVGTTPLRSLEQLGPMLVFLGIQLVEYCERIRKRDNLNSKKLWLLRFRIFGLAGAVAVAIVMLLWPTGFFGPISSRVRGLFVKHTKTGNPLVDSVAEHQAAKEGTYDQYLNIVAKIAPFGFALVALAYSNDASSFLLVYGMAAYFFSHKMVRLILLTAPIGSVLGGMTVGRVASWCIEGVCGWTLDVWEMFSDEGGHEKKAVVEAKIVKAKVNGESKKGKKKKSGEKEKKEKEADDSTTSKSTITGNNVFQLVARASWLYASFYLYKEAQPHIKSFRDVCDQMAVAMSHPTILFKAQTQSGQTVLVDDYREAYWWLRDNTPEDARIMAWWDYGYQITAIANRTTIADGNTWNHEHIALLGRALTSPLKEGHRIARHLADYVLLWTGGGGDDLAKSPHLARIANSVYRSMCPGDPTCSKFSMPGGVPSPMMQASLLYNLHSNGIAPTAHVDPNRFKEVFSSKHGKVRIYRVNSVSKESKEWVKDNYKCDAPGSWFCPGQYPPGLQKVLKDKKDFKQLEDFNAKTEADDEYQRKYFEHLSNPEKARRRAQIRDQKEAAARDGKQAGESSIDLDKPTAAAARPSEAQIKLINQKREDNEITSRVYDLIKNKQVDDLAEIFNQMPAYAHVRSKDGRGPMWWAHEHGRPSIVKLLKSHGVSEKLRDKDGITPLDLADDEL